jgi:hypothetical protein
MSSITLTPQMLAVLDAATVARLQALVSMASLTPDAAAAAAAAEPVSEGAGAAAAAAAGTAEMKAKKVLSPEHLAKMKAGREAAKLKKQLETAEVAPLAAEPAAAAPPVAQAAAAAAAPPVAQPVAAQPAAAPVKEKKGKPTAWGDWAKKVFAEHKAEIAAYKETAEQKAGAHLKWISMNMGKASPEWLAFKATWTETHAEVDESAGSSAAASDNEAAAAAPAAAAATVAAPNAVASPNAVAAPNAPAKKRGPRPMVEMSAEDLKVFLELKKAKKAKKAAAAASASAAETEPDEPEPVVTPPIAGKKRGPKPLANMTPAERALHDAKVAERKVAKEAKALMQAVGGGGAEAAH